jgi:hypothetical protein
VGAGTVGALGLQWVDAACWTVLNHSPGAGSLFLAIS